MSPITPQQVKHSFDHQLNAVKRDILLIVFVIAWLAAVTSADQPLPQDQMKARALAEQLGAEAAVHRAKQHKESLRVAIDKLEQAIPLWQAAGDRAGEAAALSAVGGIYRSLGDSKLALQRLDRALTLRRELADRRATAETLGELGTVYLVIGEIQKAVDHYTEAADLARAVEDRALEAAARNGLGRAYASWGEYDQALTAYTETLEIARAIRDQRAEAVAIGNLGGIHQARGEHQQALERFRQALSTFQALKDLARQASAISSIGAVYHSLGDARRAIGFYDEVLALARTTGNRQLIATTLNSRAMAYSSTGEHRKAATLLDEALVLARELGDPRLVGYTLHNQGEVYAALGEHRKALELQQQALSLRRSVGDRIGEARVHIAIGMLSRELREPDAAASLEEALRLASDIGDRAGEALARTGLARVARDAGHLDEARTHIEAALALSESVRSATAIHELRTSYFAATQTQYEFYLDVLMDLHRARPSEGFDALALHTSERGRSRSLVELLTESRAEIRRGIDPSLLKREQSLRRRLNAKAERHSRLLSDNGDPKLLTAATRELNNVMTELQEVEGQIRASSPRYAALTQPQPVTVADIQQHVLDGDTLLLEYALGEERSFVWSVTQTGVAAYELPKRAVIDAQARRVYELLTARQSSPAETLASRRARISDADQRFRAEAAALTDMILRPVATQLASRRLLVVADGTLRYIPFAALPLPRLTQARAENASQTSTGEPLITRHEVVNIPSATALAVLRREVSGRLPPAKMLAVLADPVFEPDDDRVAANGATSQASGAGPLDTHRSAAEAGLITADGRLPRLPFTRREADDILAVVAPSLRLKAVDFEASRATAMKTAGQYRILHFATHGFVNNEHPELSGVVLSLVDQSGKPQDGFLRLHDLYNVELPADLVVLSACRTALGKEIRGEGLVGLTRGFMYAGAARVLASLWSVEDTATAELMKRFYASLLGGQQRSPTAALRAAQLAMYQQRRWAAPYYWAAFVLQGEWDVFRDAKRRSGTDSLSRRTDARTPR